MVTTVFLKTAAIREGTPPFILYTMRARPATTKPQKPRGARMFRTFGCMRAY